MPVANQANQSGWLLSRRSPPTTGEIERHYFEQFRAHASLPEGQVVYADKPDVRILGPRRLGIEIARLYIADGKDPASPQAQTARREQVLARAMAIHAAMGGRSIELYVDFDPAQPILDISKAAERLASLAAKVQFEPTTLSYDPSVLAEGLRSVLHNGVEYPDAKWRAQQVTSLPRLDIDRLQEVVALKAQKSTEYAPCDAYWLLLVVDFMDRAQDQELVLPEGFRLPRSPFERVLVYKPQFGQVLEVPQ